MFAPSLFCHYWMIILRVRLLETLTASEELTNGAVSAAICDVKSCHAVLIDKIRVLEMRHVDESFANVKAVVLRSIMESTSPSRIDVVGQPVVFFDVLHVLLPSATMGEPINIPCCQRRWIQRSFLNMLGLIASTGTWWGALTTSRISVAFVLDLDERFLGDHFIRVIYLC